MEICARHQIEFPSGSYCPGCIASIALLEQPEDSPRPFASLGDYDLIEELGRGGMGVVYLARQRGLNRQVALKLLPSGSLAGHEFIRRFKREGELAASLQHPNIVKVHEAGELDGELYYSMELVSGGSLADWRDGKSQRPARAAQLLHTLAGAVEHAHRHGILHRDLKPANILIDENGSPKIADFGLARATESTGDLTLATHSFGSPAYMAPELIRDPRGASVASDVYSLGAILYFLLVGKSPFVSASLDELLRQVCECEPAAPRLLDPSIPRDLQKICLKVLDKNPAKRYASAGDFEEDLARFLDGRPVLARPAGPFLKTYRMARRSPWLTAAIVSLVIAIIIGVGGIARQSSIANQRADQIAKGAHQLRLNLYASDISAASVALQRGDKSLVSEILSRWENLPATEDPRGFEWHLLRAESQPVIHRIIDHRPATVTSVAVSADGKSLAVADQNGGTQVYPTEPGAVAPPIPLPSADEVAAIPEAFGAGWVLGSPQGEISWHSASGEIISTTSGRQFSVAEEKPLAVIAEMPRYHWWMKAGPAYLWDWQSQTRLREFPGEWRHCAISPDGKSIALAGLSGGLRLVNAANGEHRDIPTPFPVWALSFSKDGNQLSAGSRRAAIIWNLSQETAPPMIIPHDLTVWMTAFSPDASRFATTSSDRRVRVWNLTSPTVPPTILTGHKSEVWCAAFSRDGNQLFAGGKDGSIIAWERPAPKGTSDIMLHDHSTPPLFSPDGKLFVTCANGAGIIRDLSSGGETRAPAGILPISFSADGKALLVDAGGGKTGSLSLGSPTSIHEHPSHSIPGYPRYFRGLGNGRWIARVELNGDVNLLDPTTGESRHHLKGPTPGMRHVLAADPDGNRVVIGGHGDSSLVMHDLRNHTSIRLSPSSVYYYVCAAFSRDGKYLAGGDLSGPLHIWEAATGRLIRTLPGHPEETSAVAFSPDGKTLASMGRHQDLKLWHLPTWRELHSVNLPEAAYQLVFSPEGNHLIATQGRSENEWVEWFPARVSHSR